MKLVFNKRIIVSLVLLLVVLGFGASIVHAQDSFGVGQGSFDTLQSPTRTLHDGIRIVMQWLLGFLGVVAVLVVLYGGYIWMTAGGEADKVERAKKILIGGVIGLTIILCSYAIVAIVFSIFYPSTGNPESCTPGETRSCSINNCGGTEVCSNNGAWSGQCVPSQFCPPPPGQKASWIWQLESQTLNWKKRFGYIVSKTIDVPAGDLKLTAYARNPDGSISNIILEQAASSTSPAFTQYSNNFVPQSTTSSQFYPILTWDTTSYAIDSLWWLRTRVTPDSGADFSSSILMTRVAPAHCFNTIQDEGESSLNCGAGCSCDQSPEITAITPDNGAAGNYVTISGRYFGDDPGYVELRSDIVTALAIIDLPLVCGSDTWRDYQIIFEVPNIAQAKYDVVVCNNQNLCSADDASFTVNTTKRPGICSVTNTTDASLNAPPKDVVAGKSGDTMEILGNQFPKSGTQNVVWSFRPDNVTSTGKFSSVIDRAQDTVPQNRAGHSSIAIYNGSEYSNPFTVNVGAGGIGDPCGNGDAQICAASNDCKPGLFCNAAQSCTCQENPNVCGDNLLGGQEDCDLVDNDTTDNVPGTYQFHTPPGTNQCADYGLGTGTVSCTTECRLNTQQCSYNPFARSASQSIYAWSFLASQGGELPELAIREECDRTQTCRDEQRLPSPTPWFEGDGADNGGWNSSTTNSYIINPRACVNAIIGARFTTNVETSTINTSNIIILECDTKEGAGCKKVSIPNSPNNIIVNGDNNGADSLFQMIPGGSLTPNKWYKTIVTTGVKSIFNKSLASLSESELAKRSCNNITYTDGGTSLASPSNVAYCWNFQTRESAALCAVGCINCSPDPTRSAYANQLHLQNATPDSADNVCLSLNPKLYNWTWTEKEYSQTQVNDQQDPHLDPRNWIPGPVRNIIRKSEVLPWGAPGGGISMSQLETIYDDPTYVRLEAKENVSGNFGYCKAINDFTNPIVIEDAQCHNGTTQSPSPWKGSTNACINAMFSARFSRPMVNSSISLYSAGSQPASVTIETCTGDDLNACKWQNMTQDDLRNLNNTTDPQVVVFDYSNPISNIQLQNGQLSNLSSPLPEGFYIKDFGNLKPNTWYRVVILGGPKGVRGSQLTAIGGGLFTPDDQGTEEHDTIPQGILLTPSISPGRDFNGDLYDDYYYVFKTADTTQPCPVDTVNVSPIQKFMRFIGESQLYTAFPQAQNCNTLIPDSYQYQWRTLLNLSDDDSKTEAEIDADTTGGSGSIIATLTALEGSSLNYHQIMAIGQREGFTNIIARVKNTRPGTTDDWKQDKMAHGELTVGLGDLKVIQSLPDGVAQCTTEKLVVDFNSLVKTDSIRNNISLYKCDQGDSACAVKKTNLIPLQGLYPTGFNKPPEFVRTIIASSTEMLATSTTYRAIVRGGPSGIISLSNKELSGLNYRSSAAAGEECEPTQSFVAGKTVCTDNSTCLLDPAANVCGTSFEECQSTIYYPLNGNANSSDGFHNGSAVGSVTFAAGKINQAAVFTGNQGNGVNIPGTNLNTAQGTIAAWIKPAVADGQLHHILYFHDATLGNSGNDGFGGREMHLTLTQNKKFLFYYGTYGTSTSYMLSSNIQYNANEWYHIAGTYKDGDKLTLYVNGQEAGELLMPNKANLTSTWNYGSIGRAEQVGPNGPTDTRAFNGLIDEVKLYNRVLSSSEIAKLAQANKEESIVSYCSGTCQNLGNTNTASCGNKIVERGEDCDDGNTNNGDRCSARCLWEGSSSDQQASQGAVCGNGRIDYGEQCEDGNIASGDGCSSQCLYESNYHSVFGFAADSKISTTTKNIGGKDIILTEACDGGPSCSAQFLNTGSNSNVPVCGNNTIESGEDCDDGNTNNKDACSNSCLNNGSKYGGAVCGNGIVESGKPDSYSWTFTVAPEAKACSDVSIDGNPCPNGIRQIIFGKDVTFASTTMQYGNDTNLGGGQCESAGQSFWRKAIERIKLVMRRAIGINVVTAAPWWCQENDDVVLNEADFAQMVHQTVRKPIMKGSEEMGEVIGYQNESGEHVVNFIRNSDWLLNAEYRLKVNYSLLGVDQTVVTPITRTVTTLGQVCPIEKVKVNIWPAGEESYADNFFCSGDSCGRDTTDVYDDDQDPENKANQHLYRAWAMGRAGTDLYPVRADAFVWDMKNIPTAQASNQNLNETQYQGDQWVTGSRTSGDSELNIDASSANAGSASTAVAIRTFICANPWPTPQNFPYRDRADNCSVSGQSGANVCINTNFETYYCRDAGGPGREDDLPVLGEYRADGSLATTIKGLNQAATLPVFSIDGGNRAYLSDAVVNYCTANNTNVCSKIVGSAFSASWSDDWVDPIYHGVKVDSTGDYELIITSANNSLTLDQGYQFTQNVSVYVNEGDNPAQYARGELGKTQNKVGDINPKAISTPQTSKVNLGRLEAGKSYNILFDWQNDICVKDAAGTCIADSNFMIKKLDIINEKSDFRLIKEFLLPRGQSYADYVFGRVPQVRKATETVPGKVGEALRFDSARYSQIILREPLAISPAGGTIALWAKPSVQTATNGNGAIMRIDNAPGGGSSYVIVRAVNSATAGMIKFQMTYGDTGTENYAVLESSHEYPVDQWHYVAGVFDANKLALYVNGTQDALTTDFTPSSGKWDELYIGRGFWSLDSDPAGNSHYTGVLDEIRLYDRALSSAEIASLLTPTPAATIAGHLVNYYPFDTTSNDAIGIRVASNPTHRSPGVWYQLAFADQKKETKGLFIDDYQALSDGRTIYTNAADLSDDAKRVFGMMYVMSYTADADAATQNIYKQLATNWRFNVADADGQGGLREFGYCSIRSTKTCARSSECADQGIYSSCIAGQCSVGCYNDSTCVATKNGICLADKAKVARDTKRLADAGDAQAAIDRYANSKRCSTDHNRLCSDDSQCFGGGVCGNFYPQLEAGTYIANRSLSVWPSWQQTLSKALGINVPTDPLNRLVGCTNPYDPTTCWDTTNSRMKCPSDGWLYTYYAYNGGRTYGFYAHAEYSPIDIAWDTTQQRVFSLFSIGQLCRDDQNNLCGNGIPDTGEDCYTCPLDIRCGGQQACQRATNSTSWQCVNKTTTPAGDGDACPYDAKTQPGQCGCGVPDTDSDNDGKANCVDQCPTTSAATPNGCPTNDGDGDGVADSADNCKVNYNPDQSDVDHDGIGDLCDACYMVNGQCLQLKFTDRTHSTVNKIIYPYVSNKTAAQFYNYGSPNGIGRYGIISGGAGAIFAYYDVSNNILSLGGAFAYEPTHSTATLSFARSSGDWQKGYPSGSVRDDVNDIFNFIDSSWTQVFSWSKSSAADTVDGVMIPVGGTSTSWSVEIGSRGGERRWDIVGPDRAEVSSEDPVITYTAANNAVAQSCGNGTREGSEVCDCGDAPFDFIFATGNRTPQNRTWLCLANNNNRPAQPYYLTARPYYWCGDAVGAANTACSELQSATSNYCGDSVLTSAYEGCDTSVSGWKGYAADTANNNSSSTNQYQCSPTTCQDAGGYCGDGIRQTALESCDDGNTASADGCTGPTPTTIGCSVESDFVCREDSSGRSTCMLRCGDGINDEPVNDPTSCDDGNLNNNDGCDSTCHIENRFSCTRLSGNTGISVCAHNPPVSGDGLCEYDQGENWDNEPACAVYDGATITLKWDNSQFLSVNQGCTLCGDEGVNANRGSVGAQPDAWEKFKIELVGNTVTGKVINNGDLIQLTSLKNGVGVKFESGDPSYLHARSGGDVRFQAHVQIASGDTVKRGVGLTFKTDDNKYLDVDSGQSHNPTHLGSANSFTLYDDNGDASVAFDSKLLKPKVAGVSEQVDVVGRSIKSWYDGFIYSVSSVWGLIANWVITQ